MESAKVYQSNHNRNVTNRLTPPDTVLVIAPRPKLFEQVRQAIQTRHYSDKTEEAYVGWIKRFIFFHNNGTRRKWRRRKSHCFYLAWLPSPM